MEQEFPKMDNQYLKAEMFQDQDVPMTFKGWEKKANEDIPARNGKNAITWKQRIKYVLRYSYPEWAMDEIGEKMLGKDGQPFKNRHYDPKYPQGYTIAYIFDEGRLESGSLPLFNAFCMVRPKAGDTLVIKRTGRDKESKWSVKKMAKGEVHASTGETEIDFNAPDFSGDPDQIS